MKNNKTIIIVISIVIGLVILSIVGVTVALNVGWKKTSDEINNLWGETENQNNNVSSNTSGEISEIIETSKIKSFELQADVIANYLEEQANYEYIGLETEVTVPYTETKMTKSDFEKAVDNPEDFATGYWYVNENTRRACVTIYPSTYGAYSGVGEAKSHGCE